MMKKQARIIPLVSDYKRPKGSFLKHAYTLFNELDELIEHYETKKSEKNKSENHTIQKNP